VFSVAQVKAALQEAGLPVRPAPAFPLARAAA
jgi:hypothetical protein